jgi:hypothetical protein
MAMGAVLGRGILAGVTTRLIIVERDPTTATCGTTGGPTPRASSRPTPRSPRWRPRLERRGPEHREVSVGYRHPACAPGR